MAGKRPATPDECIRAAPREGQPHLRKLHALLKREAPKAEVLMKWGAPFFIEPRFVYTYSAHKAHLNFYPGEAAVKAFRKELAAHRVTPRGLLQVPYSEPLPEALIRRIAKFCVKTVAARKSKAFW